MAGNARRGLLDVGLENLLSSLDESLPFQWVQRVFPWLVDVGDSHLLKLLRKRLASTFQEGGKELHCSEFYNE